MKTLSKFVLNYETILFYPHYDDYGNLTTGVMGGQESLLVDMRPSELIDFNLKYYGSSLKGATIGAKTIFGGKTKVNPVVISESAGIYWLPSKATSREDCVWLALHHVKEYSGLKKGKTMVVFTNGSSIVLDVSVYSFTKRMQRAYELKGKIESRTKALSTLPVEQKQRYQLSKKSFGYVYEVNPLKYKQQERFKFREE